MRGTNDEMEDAALKMVSLHLGLVMDSTDLLNAWQVSKGGVEQEALSLRHDA